MSRLFILICLSFHISVCQQKWMVRFLVHIISNCLFSFLPYRVSEWVGWLMGGWVFCLLSESVSESVYFSLVGWAKLCVGAWENDMGVGNNDTGKNSNGKMAPEKRYLELMVPRRNGTMQIWKKMAPYLFFPYRCFKKLKSTFENI